MRHLALLLFTILTFTPLDAQAWPEFQKHIKESSGRNVDCAYCHTHPNGPVGVKPGQIDSLTLEEHKRLTQARAAEKPGQDVDSPILNPFGDHLLTTLGKAHFVQLKSRPGDLSEVKALHTSDLDGDGISDADEIRNGTLPHDDRSGNAWGLFLHNLERYKSHILLLILATALGLYGWVHLLKWFDYESRRLVAPAKNDPDTDST